MSQAINVVVNGEERSLDRGTSIIALLELLDLDPRTVVVEVNRTVVRTPTLAATELHEGDRIELVHFVGGG
ncbi:MAG: sulfur carrier protein ThiS [Gemmatimonadales bacterium]